MQKGIGTSVWQLLTAVVTPQKMDTVTYMELIIAAVVFFKRGVVLPGKFPHFKVVKGRTEGQLTSATMLCILEQLGRILRPRFLRLSR